MPSSKPTRASGCETNPFFLELFRDRSDSDERERLWHTAMAHAGEGTPPLRFPVYECLYLINAYSQKVIDLLDEACNRFGVEHEALVHYQSLIQCVRAGASQDIVSFMNDVIMGEIREDTAGFYILDRGLTWMMVILSEFWSVCASVLKRSLTAGGERIEIRRPVSKDLPWTALQ